MDAKKIIQAVDRHRDLILRTLDAVWKTPETGYKEWKTAAFAEKAFESLGYELVKAGDIPGFYADVDTGRPGPAIALMGELDSVICAAHPDADPNTGAVHACGHAAQTAGLVGAAAALKEPGALDGLSGRIRLMAVPAEELLEIGFRDELRKKGTIHYYGGKVEFLYRGFFDGIDMAMLVHSADLKDLGEDCLFAIVKGGNGCLLKNMAYRGKASHAGGAPQHGINALYAANAGLSAVNALRETFVEKDFIRFHPIVTEGGQMVNAIPDTVRVESYVRGATWEAICRENGKINRALAAGALAMGANLEIGDRPGYSPLVNDPAMSAVGAQALKSAFGDSAAVVTDEWDTGSTDMGDLSCVMPALQVYAAGAAGHGHGADYRIEDPDRCCLGAAKCLLLTAAALLEGGAEKAKEVLRSARPAFKSREEYFAFVDRLFLDRQAVEYGEDGEARVRWK